MNLFEAVKESVSPRQVADYYGLQVRNDMVSCLFHDERTPSMKLYDDHIYCFGCGKHGDVTDMVGELFGLSPKEAAEKIAHDFGISYDKQHGEYTPNKESIIAKIRREQDKVKENHVYTVLCNYLHLLWEWRTEYAPKSADEPLNPLFIKALIPYHILFMLEYNEKYQVWIGYKEVSGGDNAFKVNKYYHTEWLAEQDLQIKIDGLDMDSIYANLVRQIGGIEKGDETLGKQIADKEYRERLEKEIEKLEKLARAEKQPKKKFELVQQIKNLKAELEDC